MLTVVVPAVSVLTHSEFTWGGADPALLSDTAGQRAQQIFPGGLTGSTQTPACSLLPGNLACELRKNGNTD